MANGDFVVFSDNGFPSSLGSQAYTVAAGTTASINPGEPVDKALGATVVTSAANNEPVIGTNYMAGISASTSTETATAAGSVQVYDAFTGKITWLVAPKVPATWDTQAKYDALVGARVLADKTAGVYTMLAADGANNGYVVEPLNIALHPGKVRVSLRKAANYLA